MPRFAPKMLLCLLVALTGCASVRTTILNRHENDFFSENSKHSNQGIPITLKVPTHLRVWIEEEFYVRQISDGTGSRLVAVQLGDDDLRIRTVRTEFDFTDKLFTVDLRRPAAGMIGTDVQMDAERQYFKKIHSKVVDNTIREVTDLVTQFRPALQRSSGPEVEPHLITARRSVAFGRFDINAPDFELELSAFFDEHINGCNDCWQRLGHQPQPQWLPTPTANGPTIPSGDA